MLRLNVDGVEYRTTVRWYYGGTYNAEPPADGRVAARYRVFLPADYEERGWFRSFLLGAADAGEVDEVDEAELRRQFAASSHASSHRSDPNRRMVW